MNLPETIETFQVTTEQVQFPADQSEQRVVNDEPVRIDSRSRNAHHMRAHQLNEFTAWLEHQHRKDHTNSKSSTLESRSRASESAAKENAPELASEKIVRLDNDHTGENQSWIRQPTFDTKDYIADPTGIERTVQRLKSDGRILADMHQTEFSNPDPIRQHIEWPGVSNLLLGTPALLNLELQVADSKRRCNQIAVSSLAKGNGATTIAMTVARQIAMHGQRVLLIDADLTNASITELLNLKDHRTWIQAVSKQQSTIDHVVFDSNSNVAVLTAKALKRKVGWPRRLLDQLAGMVDTLSWDFQSIVFDCGSIFQLLSECSLLPRLANKVLLVSSNSNNHEIARGRASIANAGLDEILVIENFSKMRPPNEAKVG